jgi:hypothetical protein
MITGTITSEAISAVVMLFLPVVKLL